MAFEYSLCHLIDTFWGLNRSQEQRFEKSAVQGGTSTRRGCSLYELKVFGIFSKNRHKFPIGIKYASTILQGSHRKCRVVGSGNFSQKSNCTFGFSFLCTWMGKVAHKQVGEEDPFYSRGTGCGLVPLVRSAVVLDQK